MVTRLAKRLHEIQCWKPIAQGKPWCEEWQKHIPIATALLGDKYVFITIEEFAELREVYVTV